MNFDPCSLLESLLFAAGDSVPLDQLAEIMELTEEAVAPAADQLNREYENGGLGLRVLQLENSYQL